MPLSALEQGVPWTWEHYRDYLDALDGSIAVNAGFLVGHSALRRYVLRAEANHRAATEAELAEMKMVLADAIGAGALGLSFDVSSVHSDGNGDPVPAKGADRAEILALCDEVGPLPGTTLEGIFDGASDGFGRDELELMPEMSVRANRPLNWNLLVVDARNPERIDRHLAPSKLARERGGRVVALTMPVIVPMNMSFGNYCALNLMPGWGPIMNAPVAERIELLRDVTNRRMMVARADSEEAGMFRRLAGFADYVIGDTFSAANEGLSGRKVADIARERGDEHPFDTLIDIVIADDLRTVLWPSAPDDDDAHWSLRKALWDDPDVVLGGSDAGAHLDRMCGGSYPTQLLADALRGPAAAHARAHGPGAHRRPGPGDRPAGARPGPGGMGRRPGRVRPDDRGGGTDDPRAGPSRRLTADARRFDGCREGVRQRHPDDRRRYADRGPAGRRPTLGPRHRHGHGPLMGRLDGRVAIVTGAGGGIGREHALLLGREGAAVVVNDIGTRTGADAESVAALIRSTGGQAVASTDSATWEGADAIVATAVDTFGRLDIVVNNATAGLNDDLWRFSEAEWDLTIDVNLKGYFAMIRAAVPHLAVHRVGAIVNTSSASGFGHPSHSAYAAAKEGLVGLTRTVAMELGRFGIRCNAIRPVALTVQVAEYHDHTTRWRRLMNLTMGTGTTQMDPDQVSPAKIAPLVVWLCTDAAANVNGRTFSVMGNRISLLTEPRPKSTITSDDTWSLDALDAIAPDELVAGLTNRFLLDDAPDLQEFDG